MLMRKEHGESTLMESFLSAHDTKGKTFKSKSTKGKLHHYFERKVMPETLSKPCCLPYIFGHMKWK